MKPDNPGITAGRAAVGIAFVVFGVIFVAEGFRFVLPSHAVVVAIIIGLWSGTRFPRSISWIRWMQTMTMMMSLLVAWMSHGRGCEIGVLTLMIGMTALHLAKAIKKANVYSPD